MISGGLPDLLSYSRMSQNISDLKIRSEQARTETVTGRIADLPAALGGDVGAAQQIEKSIADNEAFQTSITRALGRAATSQLVLKNISENLPHLSAELIGAVERNDENTITLSAEKANAALDATFAALNQRFEGNSVFSGDAVDMPALGDSETLLADVRAIFTAATTPAQLAADLDFYFDDPAGGYATNIYQGGAGNAPRTEISDGDIIAFSARADEQPIRDVIRGLATIAVGSEQAASTERDDVLLSAADRLFSANDGVINMRARIGVAEERMARASERLEFEHLALNEAYNNKTARDPFEAAALLQQLESQLQASFVLTSRMSQLSLVNFIR